MKNKFFNWLANNITTAYLIIICLTIFAPLILVQKWTGINFNETGQIGDTIGGLTSPFLNFLSVTLLYLALKEQLNFNIKQVEIDKKNEDYETVVSLTNQIRQEINELKISINGKGFSNQEISGIYTFFEITKLAKNGTLKKELDDYSLSPFLLLFGFIVHSITKFLEKNYKSQINKDEKEIFYSIISKYKSPLFMMIDSLHEFEHIDGSKCVETNRYCLLFQLKILLENDFERFKIIENYNKVESSLLSTKT